MNNPKSRDRRQLYTNYINDPGTLQEDLFLMKELWDKPVGLGFFVSPKGPADVEGKTIYLLLINNNKTFEDGCTTVLFLKHLKRVTYVTCYIEPLARLVNSVLYNGDYTIHLSSTNPILSVVLTRTVPYPYGNDA